MRSAQEVCVYAIVVVVAVVHRMASAAVISRNSWREVATEAFGTYTCCVAMVLAESIA